jgi:hypothetical protein
MDVAESRHPPGLDTHKDSFFGKHIFILMNFFPRSRMESGSDQLRVRLESDQLDKKGIFFLAFTLPAPRPLCSSKYGHGVVTCKTFAISAVHSIY